MYGCTIVHVKRKLLNFLVIDIDLYAVTLYTMHYNISYFTMITDDRMLDFSVTTRTEKKKETID